eukprot:481124-Amphidinium_carterae.2
MAKGVRCVNTGSASVTTRDGRGIFAELEGRGHMMKLSCKAHSRMMASWQLQTCECIPVHAVVVVTVLLLQVDALVSSRNERTPARTPTSL